MSKFNRGPQETAVKSPVVTTGSATTHEGGQGYTRDAKGELFMLGVANLVGEDQFYEKGTVRDARYRALVHQVAIEDPKWLAGFLPWLRNVGNLRSASLVGALEATYARLAANLSPNRGLISSVMSRADEPGEALAYWSSRYGRNFPMPVKRGIADAASRLYRQRSYLKYGTAGNFQFSDVIELTHPSPFNREQSDLFRFALDARHGNDTGIPESLRMIGRNVTLRDEFATEDYEGLLNPQEVREAGMTWENVLSYAGDRFPRAKVWESVIPSMGYMALLRNLRNFDQAGIGQEAVDQVIRKLHDPMEIAASRQLPFRFYSAYRELASVRYAPALELALGLSAKNIPEFPGRTLVLIDTSGSMEWATLSAKSKIRNVDAGALFGIALGVRNAGNVDVYGFADGVFSHPIPKGASVLRETERFAKRIGEAGHGTAITSSVQRTFKNHDRVIIITDMQTRQYGLDTVVPSRVPIYGFNMQGYRTSAIPSGQGYRHEFGGLSDATFRLIPLLEAGRDAKWPWELP